MNAALSELRRRYPWPAQRPDLPEDWHGWLCPETAAMLRRHLAVGTRIVVETGSWLGVSARHILRHAPRATLVCIDTWKGSPEHHNNPDWSQRLATLYETFCRNLWEARARIIPMRTDALQGLAELHALGIVPDLVYVDDLHQYAHVLRELTLLDAQWHGVRLVGDDYNHPDVRRAVQAAAAAAGRKLTHDAAAWSLK
jgi:hypothetical protein